MNLNIKELLHKAYEVALKSKDPSTQNGALIIVALDEPFRAGAVLASDCNRFPDGVIETSERWERPLKYEYIEHAERNSIFTAARKGVQIEGRVMICPWAPCADCARAIIQSGIRELVTHKQAHDRSPERWREQIDRAIGMLREGRVKYTTYDGKIGAPAIRHNGELWEP